MVTGKVVITDAELRMLRMLAEGASSKEIARDTKHTPGTIRVYLHNLYRKMGVRGSTHAVAVALRKGWIK